MKSRRIAWLCLMAAGTMLLPACTSNPPTAESPTSGGRLLISFKDDLKTLDPAIGYDTDSWSIERQLYNGLLDYDGFSIRLRPDIAESMPTISADGRTYTFKIRKGVKFSTGREVTADDFKYSWERMLDPKTNGPMTGGPFWGGITGSQDFFNGRATHISGIKVADANTLEVDLDAANQSFLNIVAMPFGFVIPKEAVAAAGGDFGHRPVGTGPFILDRWSAGQLIVLKKNPTYFGTRPYLNEVDAQIGVTPEDAILRMQRGQMDLPQPDRNIPPALYTQLTKSVAWKSRIVTTPNLDLWYLAMNVNMKPFDNVLVRKAFNYAINKGRQVQILAGRASINNGIQAPPMPGYIANYNPLGLDANGRSIQKAKDLLKQAGYDATHSFPPQTLVYWASNADADRQAAAIRQDLGDVGVTINMQGLALNAFLDVTGRPHATALSYNGWIEDYPDPSDFVDWSLTCSSADVTANGSNVAFYCNKQADAIVDKARGDLNAGERLSLYRQFQDIVVSQDLPWVPMYSTVEAGVSSMRVRGYHLHPVWPLVLTTIWVTGASSGVSPS